MHSYHSLHRSSFFPSFYYFDSNFWYIDMHPTLAGLYPFLLGSPARCTFLLYFMFIYICLGSPARSRLSSSRSCPNTYRTTNIASQIAEGMESGPNNAKHCLGPQVYFYLLFSNHGCPSTIAVLVAYTYLYIPILVLI